MKNIALKKAIDAAGSQTKLAKALDISPQRVQFWTKSRLPSQWVIPVEKVTGVSRCELRPDLYPD